MGLSTIFLTCVLTVFLTLVTKEVFLMHQTLRKLQIEQLAERKGG